MGTPRFIISGYNGGEGASVFSGAAKYISEEQGGRLKTLNTDNSDIEAATGFMIDVPISDIISAEGDIIKVFIWENKTLKPLYDMWKYNAQLR